MSRIEGIKPIEPLSNRTRRIVRDLWDSTKIALFNTRRHLHREEDKRHTTDSIQGHGTARKSTTKDDGEENLNAGNERLIGEQEIA